MFVLELVVFIVIIIIQEIPTWESRHRALWSSIWPWPWMVHVVGPRDGKTEYRNRGHRFLGSPRQIAYSQRAYQRFSCSLGFQTLLRPRATKVLMEVRNRLSHQISLPFRMRHRPRRKAHPRYSITRCNNRYLVERIFNSILIQSFHTRDWRGQMLQLP